MCSTALTQSEVEAVATMAREMYLGLLREELASTGAFKHLEKEVRANAREGRHRGRSLG